VITEPSDVLAGGGEMGALMRAIDWSTTPVGPVDAWPQSLRTALSILLETGFPMYIAWGPEFTQFYNDGYRPILGSTKHPAAMGRSTRETFAEIWDIIGPMFAGVMTGTPTTVVDFLLPLDRHGFAEECYFIFSYSPIRQENGHVGGVLVTVTETTERVLGERRLKATQALAARTRDAKTVAEACAISGAVLGEHGADIPFALIYLLDSAGGALLECSAGVAAVSGAPARVVLAADERGPWPLAEVLRSGTPTVVDARGIRVATSAAVDRALVLPIVEHGQGAVGILVAGLSSRLTFDDRYRDFLVMVASQLGTAIASARALEEAEARAAALAELDRAKTTFFSNVSHEFRTPLTLLLGPTEEAVTSQGSLQGADLEAVHRNAQRLLKLVNTLLDFSRIEAGRVQASFEPTDLARITADLASAFRSATERAGLTLVVECPPLPEPVFVDRDMWEKVVLNLISNAFKFTFAGTIRVGLAWRGAEVELSVEDTGVGIPPDDLPRVFERFHRVGRTHGRTNEGSGIGLSLVRELVAMHAGTVTARSVVGEGTIFTVSLPTGTAHLPPERVGAARPATSTAIGATAYVHEALRWLPAHVSSGAAADAGAVRAGDARILVADDNADMREYISRLLGDHGTVDAVADGATALARAREARPDVVVADVMMPGLDGFALLRAIREDPRTRSVPVILVSARAGEEARVEGLHAGADDYLVKPFSARELIARVQAQVFRGRVRSVEEAQALRLASIFAHAPVGVAILSGPALIFDYCNDAYASMIGHRPVQGKPVREALPELAGQGVFELLEGVYATGEPYVGRSLRLLVARGSRESDEAFFDFVYQPLFEDGRISGIAVVCFEVTELAKARRTAEAANRAKDEFLAMLGHELRNPLAPILTALQLMTLRGLAGGERERHIIERQVRHVVGLVDDLLDVSRITRGKVELHREYASLADVLAKAIEMTSPAIEERRHVLQVDVPRDLGTAGDPARLAQIFGNLLTNAAKYTEPGGTIQVSAAREGADVVVCVSDTGRGISSDMLPYIFDLFVQERQESHRAMGGLGLGLAIVRNLVEAHGGSVVAASPGTGAGATFTVRLPAASPAQPEAPVAAGVVSAAPHGGCRVLVVDDNQQGAELLADSLRALGYAVDVAFDGPAALVKAATFPPDVALLDLGLPVMDGFELAERLRIDCGLDRLPLIAITGYAQAPDRQRTASSGFHGHLAKPVDVHDVDEMIRSIVATQTGRTITKQVAADGEGVMPPTGR
jgi:signal transduction histidine kinase/DNA-binding response OmpR family regulator